MAIRPELLDEECRCGFLEIRTVSFDDEMIIVSDAIHGEAWDRIHLAPVHDRWVESMLPLLEWMDPETIARDDFTELFA